MEKELGPTHPDTVYALSLTGNVLLDAHQPGEALTLLERAMSLQLLNAARAIYATSGATTRSELAELVAWMRSHHIDSK
jgi:hypothetical protein